ncbi:MAG TPA: DegT/DnrJ/EryC1/StrS family aminotransferase [Xanthobacteraceae bacterium]|jgi:dTDP-4-amino-4,6-dideoxygalactose transaminase|nr:DegT/DnrJ/EryC1/StrS family aminotransferase [Xanthobacteraceae bacterium]
MNQQPRFAPIPFVDVAAQRRRLSGRIDAAIARVLAHCQFIMGPEVGALEAKLAAFCGARHALGCASGTDALLLALMGYGLGPGDAVICPAFTFCATAEVVALVGATPVFADVDATTFNLDPANLESALAAARRAGVKAKAVMTVDLFGLPAAYDAIGKFAAAHGLVMIADAAQSFGAVYHERRVGTLAPVTTTSFFPSKPLSCYGDGGAVFTDDDDLAAVMRSVRIHGQGADKYDNVRIGINGRLDTIQAAVLIEKLEVFAEELVARERIARRYDAALRDVAIVPRVPQGLTSVWALYTIRLPARARAGVMAALAAQGIPTGVYYPKPLHRQAAYRHYPVAGNGLPVTDRLADEVLSLPMHAYLDEATQDRIVGALRAALGQ